MSGFASDGPWANLRTTIDRTPAEDRLEHIVNAWFNATYVVMHYVFAEHPGIDLLSVRRIDEEPIRDWADLQRIKDRLAPDGQLRTAVEVYPPRLHIVDEANLYHLWVMPKGWVLGPTLAYGQPGAVNIGFDHAQLAGVE